MKNEATQGADIILASNGKLTLGCGGDECTWRASCTPFGEGGGHYNFTGVFRVNAFGEKQLIVEGFVPATAQQ